MKIQCDVCGLEEASVICCADEAALCRACDRRVHSANKLAGKHQRLSLLHPSSTPRPLPLCDICKEKRGYVFCQEDRAILCADCDEPIHAANTHTAGHNRFLLTGFRLPSSILPSAKRPSLPSEAKVVSCGVAANSRDSQPAVEEDAVSSSGSTNENSDGRGSSISDYLMKILPGWRVDDFLFDDADCSGHAPAKNEQIVGGTVAEEEGLPFWVPRYRAPLVAVPEERLQPMMGAMEGSGSAWRGEDVSMVPQWESQYKNNKRSRASLWC